MGIPGSHHSGAANRDESQKIRTYATCMQRRPSVIRPKSGRRFGLRRQVSVAELCYRLSGWLLHAHLAGTTRVPAPAPTRALEGAGYRSCRKTFTTHGILRRRERDWRNKTRPAGCLRRGRAEMRRTPNVLLLAAACKAGVMNENFPLPFDVHIRSTRIVATVQSEQFELRPTAFDYCLTMSGFLIY